MMGRVYGPEYGPPARVKMRAVQIAYERGLLEDRGAQTELARILGTTRQNIYRILTRVRAEGSAIASVEA